MIKELSGRRRLFFPRALVNAIVRWILGVHSPTGTIRIANTATPDAGRSVALDVDMDAVMSACDKRAERRGLSKPQREAVRDTMRAHLDGNSLVWGEGVAQVNTEWLDKYMEGDGTASDNKCEAPSQTTAIVSGWQATPSMSAEADGTFTGGDAGGDGVVLYVLTRVADHGASASLFFRPITVTSDGRIYNIGAESDAQAITVATAT